MTKPTNTTATAELLTRLAETDKKLQADMVRCEGCGVLGLWGSDYLCPSCRKVKRL